MKSIGTFLVSCIVIALIEILILRLNVVALQRWLLYMVSYCLMDHTALLAIKLIDGETNRHQMNWEYYLTL